MHAYTDLKDEKLAKLQQLVSLIFTTFNWGFG